VAIHLPGTDLGASLVLEICWSKEASLEEKHEHEHEEHGDEE